MTITPNLVIEPILLLVGAGLYLAGFLTCAVLVVAKSADKPAKNTIDDKTAKSSPESQVLPIPQRCKGCINSNENNPRWDDEMCGECMRESIRIVRFPYAVDDTINARSCLTCKHSVDGSVNTENGNCVKCHIEYVFAGYARRDEG